MRIYLIATLFLAASLNSYAASSDSVTTNNIMVVHTEELKRWYDTGKQMTIVDARTEENYDNITLPKAIWLPADAPTSLIQSTLPIKDQLIVVYCWSLACPASGKLTSRLKQAGYTKVYEYSEGLEDWMQNGYPTVTQSD